MTPWWGHLKFRMCSSGKIKYGVLLRIVCGVVSGYFSKMKIHTAKGLKLEDKILSVLDRNLSQNHHICQASVRSAEILLDR